MQNRIRQARIILRDLPEAGNIYRLALLGRLAGQTDADIQAEIDGINSKITAANQDQITALTGKIQTDNAGLPQDQIDALVQTAVDKLVASALTAQSAGQIQILIDQAGIATPSAVITLNVWTSQGA